MLEKFKDGFKGLWKELLTADDSPHKIALSFAVGVFLGVMPFTGIVATIAVALIFRLNKPAAILGSLITNAWVSFIALGFSLQTGSWILGKSVQETKAQFDELIHGFHFNDLFSLSFLKLLAPLAVGFIAVSLLFAVVSYVVVFLIIYWRKSHKN
jgi:uncharacterized protein